MNNLERYRCRVPLWYAAVLSVAERFRRWQ